MFENRRRQRRKNILLFIVAFVLLSAFSLGYYLNYGGGGDVGKNTTMGEDPTGYRIPDSIKNPTVPAPVIPQVEADDPQDDSTNVNANTDKFITPNTKVMFKTYFTLCGHMLDKDPDKPKELINLTEDQLRNKFADWTIKEFSKQQVILTREKQTYCPRHYIIGVKDGYIAIYVYNSEGEKVLQKETETPISILPPADQTKLEYGIVVDNEEELQETLEGFSE